MPIKRIITAIILIAIIANGVLFLSTNWVAILLGIPMLFGIVEWSVLSGFNHIAAKIFIASTCAISALIWYWLVHHTHEYILTILILTSVWWLIISWYITRIHNITTRNQASTSLAITGIFILLTTWGSLIWLHSQPHGPMLLLYLLILIWITDSSAYFTGSNWGQIKFVPLLSPNKTVAGVYGGLAGAIIWGILLAILFGTGIWYKLSFLALSLLTALASIVGDLYESLLKRERNLKDSGDLLPGHGGILDRIDSLTAAAPIFVLGLILLGVV
jgi:phosphatidate cytidylyltransferase